MIIKKYLLISFSLVLLLALTMNNSSFAQAARQKDATVVAVNELTDVEGTEWAYNAVQQLVEKYDVLEGYPDGTYKGKKPSTRFELAAAVYDLATYFSDEIALDREDLSKLAKLLDEFSNEIKTIQGRVDTLEGKVTALDTKVTDIDTRTTTLEGQIAEHKAELLEHEKRLAYAERRKGFLIERLAKGLVVDLRDITRGLFAAVSAPFNKDINAAISK